jgi:hypothetical protein
MLTHRVSGITCCAIQEAYENERLKLSDNRSRDPPQWSTLDKRRPVAALKDIEYPSGYDILLDWAPEISPLTDSSGWQYGLTFNEISAYNQDSASETDDNVNVRHRKWQRLTVERAQYEEAKQKYDSDFEKDKSLFRSISPALLQHLFFGQQGEQIQIQMILESERSLNGEYSSDYLLPTDPPHWSSGSGENAPINPKLLRLDQLKEVVGAIYNGGNGWETLHDFIYQLSSDTDPLGWQYNTNFTGEVPWTNDPSSSFSSSSLSLSSAPLIMNVRRRLWFRTCVADSHLCSAQDKFLTYFAQRPRGVIKMGNLQRQGPLKLIWYDSFVTLRDSQLEVILLKYESPFGGKTNASPVLPSEVGAVTGVESAMPSDEWYLGKNLGLKKPVSSLFTPSSSFTIPAPRQLAFLGGGVVRYPLQGCEVIELSALESAESATSESDSSSKMYQFGLRTGKSWGQLQFSSTVSGDDEPDSLCRYTSQENHRLLCVFNAYSRQDYEEWICTLRNQIALVNLHFWPFLGSPPILDRVLIEGYLWIRGQQLLLPSWKYRKFELRQDGVLAYYKDNKVIGKIRLRLCYVEECEPSSSFLPSEITCGPFLRTLTNRDSSQRNSISSESQSQSQHQEQHLFQIRNDFEDFEVILKTSTVLDKMRWMRALQEHSNVEKLINSDGLSPFSQSFSSNFSLNLGSVAKKHYSTASGLIRRSNPDGFLMAVATIEDEEKNGDVAMDRLPSLWQSPDNGNSDGEEDGEKSGRLSSFHSF